MAYRAFFDANVLVPARVRDLLLTLGEADAYTPLWSPDVLEEIRRHLPATMDSATADHLFGQMARAFPEASVAWPGEVDISIAELVNPHDHHVVSACLWAHADVMVTDDGPLTKEVTALVDCQSAGVFVTYAIDSIGDQAVEALLAMARRWAPEALDEDALLERLLRWMHGRGWDSAASELERLARVRLP